MVEFEDVKSAMMECFDAERAVEANLHEANFLAPSVQLLNSFRCGSGLVQGLGGHGVIHKARIGRILEVHLRLVSAHDNCGDHSRQIRDDDPGPCLVHHGRFYGRIHAKIPDFGKSII